MATLSFTRLREANLRLCGPTFPPLDSWSPCDYAVATKGELEKAAVMVTKLRQGGEVELWEIATRLANTVIYLDLFAARLDIDLERVVRLKFNENSVKYGSEEKI